MGHCELLQLTLYEALWLFFKELIVIECYHALIASCQLCFVTEPNPGFRVDKTDLFVLHRLRKNNNLFRQ